MNKKAFSLSFVFWVVCLALVTWLVSGSTWLNLILSIALSQAFVLQLRVDEQRQLFDIADAELVRVSSLVVALENELADTKSRLEQAESHLPGER